MTELQPLELLIAFVNTHDVGTGADAIASPESAQSWLVAHGLLDEGTAIDPHEHAELLAFRQGVRNLARAHPDGDLDRDSRTTLTDLGARVALSIELDDQGSLQLHSRGDGVLEPVGRLLAIMHNASIDGTLTRLKPCTNDTCQWLFLDHSKNRSRRWCDMTTCGNAANARAYRRRLNERTAE